MSAESAAVRERGRASAADVRRMMSKLLITEGADHRLKSSAFWILIVLSTVIASAGVMGDSTATVIGAMIVAPLMTPILGAALSIVLGNRRLILVNLGLVLAGALTVIAIAYLLGMTSHVAIVADTNSQVAARISPKLIDLLAAVATGVVGAFAMVRSDISDTLPGVAIAISLVPPLAVVGLTLESGAPAQALGALLLFGTNVTAIIATGTIVFLGYRVRAAAVTLGAASGEFHLRALVPTLAAVVVIAIPLAAGSSVVAQQQLVLSRAAPVADQWAQSQGWRISDLSVREGALRIVALGPPPTIQEAGLREQLDQAGLADIDVQVTLVLGGSVTLPGKR